MTATGTLGERTARAAQWRFASAIVGGASQFGLSILVAHLLTPADVGLVALAMIVVSLAQRIGDLGIGNAVVQSETVTERQIRTAFTFSVVLGVVIAAILFTAAPAAATLVRDQRVSPILRVLAAIFALQGPAIVAAALLRRALDFRTQFVIDTIGYVVGYGGVTALLAFRGYGVWSLVWGAVAQTLLASVAQLVATRHPAVPFLSTAELRSLLRFGFGAAAIGVVNFLALNGDNFVVGRWMGAASLGLYTWAYVLMTLPHIYVANVMSGALFPAFAQVQRAPARLRRGYLLFTRITALIAAPAMTILAIGAPHLVRALYGDRWTGVVLPLQILCVAGYFRVLYHVGGVLAQSVGRVYGELWRQIVYAALVVGGALIGTRAGLPGVAAGVGVAILYMFVATGRFALRATGTSWGDYVGSQRAGLVTAAIVTAVALPTRWLLEGLHAPSLAIAAAIVAAAAIPWAAALLSSLRDPDLDPLRAQLPPWLTRLCGLLPPRAV